VPPAPTVAGVTVVELRDAGMHRSRVVAGCTLAVLSFALASCSGGADRSTTEGVTLVISSRQLNFAKEMAAGFTAGAAQVGGVQATVAGPDGGDPTQAVKVFEDAVRSSKGGIAVQTIAPELFAGPLADAEKAGIPLMTVDTPPGPGSNVEVFVGNDNYALGQQLAAEAIKRLPTGATGTVVIGTPAPGLPILDARARGMRAEFAKRLPRVRVLGPFDTKLDVPANAAAWSALVRANPDALAFLGTGDADTFNLAKARVATRGKWLAAAFDVDPKALEAVRDGQLFAVMSPEHYLKGMIAGRLQAEQAKSGKALPKGWIYTPGLAVTSANIAEITERQSSPANKQAWFGRQADAILGDPSSVRPLDSAH
jgi:ribose transport system substrate-binding protein